MDAAVFTSGSKALAWFLGSVVIFLAIAVTTTSTGVSEVLDWVHQSFGITFMVFFASLVMFTLYCWIRFQRSGMLWKHRKIWFESALHTANGVATLGLTYTLLGISLGIASLAQQELTPETVQGVISQITSHFSMAFLTSVVGVPTAAILRAVIMITAKRLEVIYPQKEEVM